MEKPPTIIIHGATENARLALVWLLRRALSHEGIPSTANVDLLPQLDEAVADGLNSLAGLTVDIKAVTPVLPLPRNAPVTDGTRIVLLTQTNKEYHVHAYGHNFVVPAGSLVSNQTAMGPDNDYHFWFDYDTYLGTIPPALANVLRHELEHRGINVPAELCDPWPDHDEI